MRFPRNRQIFRGQLDVAAFASVLFLLLIFILLRSQLVFTPGVPIRLIEADDTPEQAPSGRASLLGSPFAGTPIHYDDLLLTSPL